MNHELKSSWLNFLEGKWTRDAPLVPGRYYLADHLGRPSSNALVVLTNPAKGVSYAILGKVSDKSTSIWGGWFWSMPTPDMPGAPTSAMCDALNAAS